MYCVSNELMYEKEVSRPSTVNHKPIAIPIDKSLDKNVPNSSTYQKEQEVLTKQMSFGGPVVPENDEESSSGSGFKDTNNRIKTCLRLLENLKEIQDICNEVDKRNTALLPEEIKNDIEKCINFLKMLQKSQRSWREVYGIKSGKKFYHNCVTGEKQWNTPNGFSTLMEEPSIERVKMNPEYEKVLENLMQLADIDGNGAIEKEELIHNRKASNLLGSYFEKIDGEFLTREIIVDLIPEIESLTNLVEELESCLSYESPDPYLMNKKLQRVDNISDESLSVERTLVEDKIKRQTVVLDENTNLLSSWNHYQVIKCILEVVP